MSQQNLRKLSFIGFLILVAALFFTQIVQGRHYLERSRKNYMRLIPRPGVRGIIYDRNGVALVKNQLRFEVGILPTIRSREGVLRSVAEILGVSFELLKENYRKNIVAPFIPVVVYTTTEKDKIIRLEEESFPEVLVNVSFKREAIFPVSCAHVLGYTQKLQKQSLYLLQYGYKLSDEIGYTGIEEQYNAYLHGQGGGEQVEVDARGRLVNYVSRKLPQKGKDIYLTIDAELQDKALAAFGEYRGALILMDAQNGEIITLVSVPSYDLNGFIHSSQSRQHIMTARSRPLMNRAIQAEYPLGSLIKPLIAWAGLETGKISLVTHFFCSGTFSQTGRTYRCTNSHGWQDVRQALTHSCNIFFYTTGLKLGAEKISQYAFRVGLGKKTGVDIPSEKKGLIPTPHWKKERFGQRWFDGDTVNFSIGQGYVLATPIQAARFMSLFANRRFLVHPHFVRKIEDNEVAIASENISLSDEILEHISLGLRGAVQDVSGTAHILNDLGLNISGKTGTAQNPHGPAHGWFSGFFSVQGKPYVIVTFTENSGSSAYACQVTHRFLDGIKEKLQEHF